jgi:hypothetical protein
MQPAGPPSGQLDVALVPAGHIPLAGTGLQAGAAQFWWLTQSWLVVQGAASPHGSVESTAPSLAPASEVSEDLQPTTASSASSA